MLYAHNHQQSYSHRLHNMRQTLSKSCLCRKKLWSFCFWIAPVFVLIVLPTFEVSMKVGKFSSRESINSCTLEWITDHILTMRIKLRTVLNYIAWNPNCFFGCKIGCLRVDCHLELVLIGVYTIRTLWRSQSSLCQFLGNKKYLTRSTRITPPRTCNQDTLNPKISARIAHINVANTGITISVATASASTLIWSDESFILSWMSWFSTL